MAQAPQLNDSQLNLLAKIASNTGETQPKHGDGQHNLLFKIAQNTYASAGLASSALQSSGDGYVLVQQSDDLAAKYAEAKAKNPSATNRVTLFIVPGTYSLSSELAIDAEYVDIVGLGAQFQSPAVIVANNTLNVTANDVRVSGISVGTQEFKIASNKPLQVFENCKGGNNSFAGNGGTASGTFVGCVGGDDSFGGYDIEQSSTASFVDCIAGDDGFGGNTGEYPSGKYISCRITSGSFPTIYIPGRARFCLDDDYNIVNADGGYDSDAESYFTAAGVTDDTAKDQLNLFVIGVKRLGLWNDMVCWPLRSAQNAGTGSTAYSLGGLGTYNGTLVNGPTWGADGITITSTAVITDGLGAPTFPASLVVAGRRVAGTGDASWDYLSATSSRQLAKRMYANNSAGLAITGVGYIMLVNTNAQTLTDDFEVVTGIVPSATNSAAEFFVNTTKPAQTAGATAWGAGASTGGTLQTTGDGQFEASLHAVFTTTINATAFYSLYRKTLGQGLGLP